MAASLALVLGLQGESARLYVTMGQISTVELGEEVFVDSPAAGLYHEQPAPKAAWAKSVPPQLHFTQKSQN